MNKAWFETWFNTKYYHLLYRNRNEVEARRFIDALLRFLDPRPKARFIDVACGKGRHSRYLHSLGYDVTGIDLSANSIAEAQKLAGDDAQLRFIQHDIRDPFPVSDQDVAVNLFTSFGYFDSDSEHLQALQHMHDCLLPGGRLVLDFLNTSEVSQNLKREDKSTVDGVRFNVYRKLEEQSIVKHIEVQDGSEVMQFQERVRAFSKDDLERLLKEAGFEIGAVFGNYMLDTYHAESPRVVIIAQKKA